MKKAIRAAVSVLFVLVFAIVGLSSVVHVGADDSLTPNYFLGQENIALNKGTFVSSFHPTYGGGNYTSDKMVDGLGNEVDSRWQAQENTKDNNIYAGIDLGEKTAINSVYITWESIPGKDKIALQYYDGETAATTTSSNAKGEFTALADPADANWKDVTVVNSGYNDSDKYTCYDFKEVETRYIRVYITADSGLCNGVNASIYEFGVYNVQEPLTSKIEEQDISVINNIALGKEIADVSSVGDSKVATNVVDGKSDSYWQGAGTEVVDGYIDYIVVDLGSIETISKLRILWGGGYPGEVGYDVLVSDDGENFGNPLAVSITDSATDFFHHNNTVVLTEVVSARYVKIAVKEKSDAQMWELEVYGPVTTAAGTVTLATSEDSSVVRDVFVATNINKKEMPEDCFVLASYTITAPGVGTATGEVKIYSAYQSITLGNKTIDASDFEGAAATDYVSGVLFKNVPANASVDVVFTVVDDILD